ncbi:hypothetical protein NIZ92_07205 [Alcaligenes sp. 1735tsa3]|nr:hypothetical protein [Alcaligenes sp. 1735tsa3]USY26819.1 hypothetical protein NIZ92_07205 [Alcaligenes sp. 1735tsa3]
MSQRRMVASRRFYLLHNAAGITAKTISALTQDNFSASSNMTDIMQRPT